MNALVDGWKESTMDRTNLRIYEIASAIVWLGLLASVALILEGSRHLTATLLVLAAGAVFFLLILPSTLYPTQRSKRRH
jgi:hypothetical protein